MSLIKIEIKKYPKADLKNYRGVIFGLSMVLTMSLVITAFEWKSYERGIAEIQSKAVNSFEILADIPPTDIPPPPPPAVSQTVFVEVPDEEVIMDEVKINIDVEMNQETRTEEIMIRPILPTIEKEDENAVFTIVETPSEPMDGFEAFYRYIGERIKYPAQARRMGVEGKVFVEFVVNKDGSLTEFQLVKGIGAGCDEEAIRVLQSAPRWKPGKQRGRPVRQKMILPITFKLGDQL